MKQKGNIVVILSVLVAIGASFAAGYFYLKSQTPMAIKTAPITTTSSSPTGVPTSTVAPSITVTPKAGHTAVVVFEGALNSGPDKATIQARIVNPLLDYYADENGEGYIVSLTVSPNAYESKDTYPYSTSVVFKNGGNSGFLIQKTNGTISWWAPECMKCTFSADFTAKYPEIVKLFK